MTNEDAIFQLNGLIETARNGELGYLTAAQHVANTQLETVFLDYAKQRAGFVKHLQAEVERLGGTPATSGTIIAALHRGWIDLKSAVTGGDGASIIAACETGEDSGSAAFERVVNMDLTGETKTLVEKQYKSIVEAHKHMLHLKEQPATDYPKTD